MIIDYIRSRQPQNHVYVDSSNRLNKGLWCDLNFIQLSPKNAIRNGVEGEFDIGDNLYTFPSLDKYKSINFAGTGGNGGSGDYFEFYNPIGATPAGTVTLLVNVNDITNSDAYLFAHSDFGGGARIYLGTNSAGNWQVRLGSASASTFGAAVEGEWVCLTAKWSGTTSELFVNGVSKGTGSVSSTPGSDSAYTTIGGYTTNGLNTSYNSNAKIARCIVHKRELTSGEVRALHQNIWATLQPDRLYIPYAAAGGGVTASLTGQAATTAAGTLTATGAAIATLTGTQSTSSSGAITATGGAVTLLTGQTATTSANSVTILTGTITQLTGVNATAQAGTLNLIGNAVVSITGVAATGQAGSITIGLAGGITVNLTGVASTTAVNSLSIIGGAITNLTGVSANGVAGNINISLATIAALAGVSANAVVGAVDITAGAIISIDGVSATGQAGTVTASGVSVTLTTPEIRTIIIQSDDRTIAVLARDNIISIN